MPQDEIFLAAKLTLAITKATNRPELLPYLKRLIRQDIIFHLNNLTDNEVHQFMEDKGWEDQKEKTN